MKSISEMTPAERLDERFRLEWELDPMVREEFAQDFGVYASYRKAEENGQIGFGPKTQKETLEDIMPLPRHLAPHQIEQELQSRWNRSTALRQEFGGNFEPFRAYCIAQSKGLCA